MADLYTLVRRFFRQGLTAHIGCGSGNEVAWLAANGFPAVGCDPSEGLLAQARSRYPGLAFNPATLPDLAGIPDGSFDNVLCVVGEDDSPRRRAEGGGPERQTLA